MTLTTTATSSTSTITSRINLSGQLFDDRNHRVKNGKFQVYDANDKYIAFARTDKEGKFEFDLPANIQPNDRVALIFRSCVEEHLASDHPLIAADKQLAKNLRHIKVRTEKQEATLDVALTSLNMNLGKVILDKPYESQKVPLSYTFNILSAVLPAEFKTGIETLKEKFDFFNTHDVTSIKKAFDVPDVALTSENAWKMMTNGICPQHPKRKHGLLLFEVNWDAYSFDKLESLPNTRMYFDDTVNPPKLVRVELQYRNTLHPSSDDKDKGLIYVYIPGLDNFEIGFRAALSAFLAYGETVFHLGLDHVYPAKVSQQIHDYFVGTSLEELLFPHCQFIEKISFELGKNAIFGQTGILNESAMDVAGIGWLISDSEAGYNPLSFEGRTPLSENHLFAIFQRLHYEVIGQGLRKYFENKKDAILADWPKIYRFFRKLHRMSPTYRPWDGQDPKTAGWIDNSEIGGNDDKVPPRTKFQKTDPGVRAMPRIAKNPKGPEGDDWEMVQRFFIDFIATVTGKHSWIHPKQYEESEIAPHARDPNFSPITVNNFGEGIFGGITIEELTKQEEILEIFRRFPMLKYALIHSNACQEIKDAVIDAEAKYKACGMPLEQLTVSTVI